MSAREPQRPHTRAIRDILKAGPATADEITARTWHLFPAGPCIAAYRKDIDYFRRRAASDKVGYDASIDEQHRIGAKRMIAGTLGHMVSRGTAVKEGDRYRLVN